MYIDDDLGYKAIVAAGFEPKTVEKILGMVDRAEYKRRQGAIGTKITKNRLVVNAVTHW